jgi:hypothetical protein
MGGGHGEDRRQGESRAGQGDGDALGGGDAHAGSAITSWAAADEDEVDWRIFAGTEQCVQWGEKL